MLEKLVLDAEAGVSGWGYGILDLSVVGGV